MNAYEVADRGTRTGVVFAASQLGGVLRGAAAFNEGEISGIEATRAPWADRYGAAERVPAAEMVRHGFTLRCSTCHGPIGTEMDEPEDADHVLGTQHSRIHCAAECRDRNGVKKAA
jgi:hypothetical protein